MAHSLAESALLPGATLALETLGKMEMDSRRVMRGATRMFHDNPYLKVLEILKLISIRLLSTFDLLITIIRVTRLFLELEDPHSVHCHFYYI
jgi:hypothetical protein